jgi:DNA-binding CsgD family transcriptional regulator
LEAAFNSAKRACYAGLDSITLRREIAQRIAGAIHFDSYAFSTCDPDTGLMNHTVAAGVPEALARTYVEIFYPAVLARLGIDLARDGRKVLSIADQPPAARRAIRRHGLRQQLHVLAAANGRLWGTWCLMRGNASSAVTRREYNLLNRLTPHLVRGLQSAALIDRAISPVPADHDAAGVLVLDARNRPMLRTGVTAAWIEDLSDIGLQMAENVPLAIVALASQVRAMADERGFEQQLRARGRSGKWYTLRASLAEPDAAGECAVVVVIRPALPQEIGRVLTALYALSPREREVVAAVARGEATKTIADALRLSPHTVTEHIQRACDKIGVRGRKALIAKLFFDGYAPTLKTGRPTLADAARQVGQQKSA